MDETCDDFNQKWVSLKECPEGCMVRAEPESSRDRPKEKNYTEGLQDEETIKGRTWVLMTSDAMWLTSLASSNQNLQKQAPHIFHANDFNLSI